MCQDGCISTLYRQRWVHLEAKVKNMTHIQTHAHTYYIDEHTPHKRTIQTSTHSYSMHTCKHAHTHYTTLIHYTHTHRQNHR